MYYLAAIQIEVRINKAASIFYAAIVVYGRAHILSMFIIEKWLKILKYKGFYISQVSNNFDFVVCLIFQESELSKKRKECENLEHEVRKRQKRCLDLVSDLPTPVFSFTHALWQSSSVD